MQAPAPPPPPPAAEIRILALGDSYTIGESVRGDERWPAQLTAMLRRRRVRVADPTIVARTGWTTDELLAEIDAVRLPGPYDLVTLLIGVNNQYRGRSSDEYRAQFRSLLDRASHLAGGRAGRVIVVSIPDWGVTPFGTRSGRDPARIAPEIDAFNAIALDETTRMHGHFVDVTPMSRRAASDAVLVAGDGLHPSATMYAEWTNLVLPVATRALGLSNPRPR